VRAGALFALGLDDGVLLSPCSCIREIFLVVRVTLGRYRTGLVLFGAYFVPFSVRVPGTVTVARWVGLKTHVLMRSGV
jgi:hypothetical protein